MYTLYITIGHDYDMLLDSTVDCSDMKTRENVNLFQQDIQAIVYSTVPMSHINFKTENKSKSLEFIIMHSLNFYIRRKLHYPHIIKKFKKNSYLKIF